MKLGKIEVKLAEDKNNKPILDEIGATGTNIFSGFITEEYNPKLKGSKAIDIYERMRKSDTQVRASLKICELPIRSAEATIQCGTENPTPQEEEQRVFIEDALFNRMTITWDDFLRQALLMLTFGFMTFEKVFKLEDGKIYWKKFAPRLPKTIKKWVQNENSITGVEQQAVKDSRYITVNIPIEKLLIFTNDKEGDNFEGTSILRSAYKNWWFKESLEQIDAIGIERQGVGVPHFQLPPDASEEEISKAEIIGESLRANEKAFLITPNTWKVEILGMAGNTVRDAGQSIERHNRAIMQNILAQFMELGKETGSYALSQDQSGLFLSALQSVAKYIEDTINNYAIKQLINYNFSNVRNYPVLRFSKLGDIDYSKIADAISKLSPQGFIKSDQEMENYLRRIMRLPKVNPEAQEAKQSDQSDEIQQPDESNNNEGLKDKTISGSDKKKIEMVEKMAWRRDLTTWEKTLNLADINDTFDTFENKFLNAANTVASLQLEKLMRDLKDIINNDKLGELYKLTIKDKGKHAEIMKKYLEQLYNYGSEQAADQIGVKAAVISEIVKKQITAQANMAAEIQADDLKKTAMLTVYGGITNGSLNPTQILEGVRAAIESKMGDLIKTTGSVMIQPAITRGMGMTYDKYLDDIYAYQISEILDDKTCDECASVDGSIIPVEERNIWEEEPHPNCRRILVAIKKDEAELPEITGMPEDAAPPFSLQQMIKAQNKHIQDIIND